MHSNSHAGSAILDKSVPSYMVSHFLKSWEDNDIPALSFSPKLGHSPIQVFGKPLSHVENYY